MQILRIICAILLHGKHLQHCELFYYGILCLIKILKSTLSIQDVYYDTDNVHHKKKITHVHRKFICMATHPKVDPVISRVSVLGNLYLSLPFRETQNKQISLIY